METKKQLSYDDRLEIEKINNILYPLIVEQGQSIHHAYINNIDSLMCSEREIYNLISNNVLLIKSIDLPRTVQRKRRNKQENHFKIEGGLSNFKKNFRPFLFFVVQ